MKLTELTKEEIINLLDNHGILTDNKLNKVLESYERMKYRSESLEK